jgi:hypothetical protein
MIKDAIKHSTDPATACMPGFKAANRVHLTLWMGIYSAIGFYAEKKEEKTMERGKLNFMLNEVKLFLNFNTTDLMRLKKIHPTIKPLIPQIVGFVLKRIGGNPKLVSVIENYPLPIEAARTVFENWLDQIFTSNYDADFARRTYEIAEGHEKAGINPKYVTMTMGTFILAIDFVVSKMVAQKETLYAFSLSIKKAMLLNLTLMTQSYEEIKRGKILQTLEHV